MQLSRQVPDGNLFTDHKVSEHNEQNEGVEVVQHFLLDDFEEVVARPSVGPVKAIDGQLPLHLFGLRVSFALGLGVVLLGKVVVIIVVYLFLVR